MKIGQEELLELLKERASRRPAMSDWRKMEDGRLRRFVDWGKPGARRK